MKNENISYNLRYFILEKRILQLNVNKKRQDRSPVFDVFTTE